MKTKMDDIPVLDEIVLPLRSKKTLFSGPVLRAKTWDPADLRQEAEPEAMKLWEPIAAIAFTAAAMILFNGYPQVIGANFLRDGAWVSIPALTDAFFRWLPYMNVLWALQIALNVVLLRQGRWELPTRLASIVLDAGGIAIGYLLLIGPPIVNISAEAMAAAGLSDPGTAAALNAVLQQAVRLAIVVLMIVQGVNVVKEIVRLILRRRMTLACNLRPTRSALWLRR